jgi:hypothetical protein
MFQAPAGIRGARRRPPDVDWRLLLIAALFLAILAVEIAVLLGAEAAVDPLVPITVT